MGIHVTISEAEKRLAELAAAALRGEEVVLDMEGGHRVRLLALAPAPLPMGDAEREARAESRRSLLGRWRDEFDGTSIDVRALKMTDDEWDEHYRRKFADPD